MKHGKLKAGIIVVVGALLMTARRRAAYPSG